ncbi:unnamed protein product [Larinioides sclopetarius]|uniref:Secreted protein n=1 Tax=Larinioides sclopetarius TaxID=280406 RepID=A0AAV2BF85_9ARAC
MFSLIFVNSSAIVFVTYLSSLSCWNLLFYEDDRKLNYFKMTFSVKYLRFQPNYPEAPACISSRKVCAYRSSFPPKRNFTMSNWSGSLYVQQASHYEHFILPPSSKTGVLQRCE